MSKFRVRGRLDGAVYEVEVTGDKAAPVAGSKRVRALVDQHVGDDVLVSPVGPVYTVDPGDPASVLALLCSHTTVIRVTGDAPTLVESLPEGHAR